MVAKALGNFTLTRAISSKETYIRSVGLDKSL